MLERLTAGVPAPAARAASTAGLVLLLASALALRCSVPGGRRCGARQPGGGADGAGDARRRPTPVGADENWLVRNIMCQCGTCRHNLLECESDGCGHAVAGPDRRSASCSTRADPRPGHRSTSSRSTAARWRWRRRIDRGFNRLAWLFPYSSAAVAAGGLGYGAYRLAKRPRRRGRLAADAAISDPELADKLDDELRNLD